MATTKRIAMVAMVVLLACSACEVGDVTVSTSGGGTGGEDGSTVDESSASDSSGESTTSSSSTVGSESSDSSSGDPLPGSCDDAFLGSHDWMFSGCCTEPFGTCTQWCSDHGFGECLLVAFTEDASGCSEDAETLSLDLCGTDLLDVAKIDDLGVRCVCNQP